MEINNDSVARNEEKRKLQELKILLNEYLRSESGNEIVKDYLQTLDDKFLLNFILGRKGNVEYAWKTLKQYAEVKLVKYPEMFPHKLPDNLKPFQDSHTGIFLKARDKDGRRIFIFNSSRWDVKAYSLLDLCQFGTLLWDKLLRDEDCMRNGLVLIQDSSEIGIKHCSQYSVKTLRQLLSVFWHAYPVRFKAVYFVNTPKMLCWALNLASIFFPKKLTERLTITSADAGNEALYDVIPKENLPKFLGGTLEVEEAMDYDMIVS